MFVVQHIVCLYHRIDTLVPVYSEKYFGGIGMGNKREASR